MKYVQQESLEAKWKWEYLIKKIHSHQKVTHYLDVENEQQHIDKLYQIENKPSLINAWIELHIDKVLYKKLKQAIRAKRKRYFNASNLYTKKKSIDLDYVVWKKLATKAETLESTLSDTIDYLLAEHEENSSQL